MSLTSFLPDLILSEEEVDKLFTFEGEIKLKDETYADIICENFGKKIKCPVNLEKKSNTKASITFYLHCIINKTKKYSIKCFKSDIKQYSSLKFSVLSSDSKKCVHGDVIEGRQLRGQKREDAKKSLLKTTPKQIHQQQVSLIDKEQCFSGNMTGIHPLQVLQKARSESLSKNDKNKDDVQDLLEEAEQERSIGSIFIQKIDLLPFSVILFHDDNLNLLHDSFAKNNNIQLYLDATGGIVRSISNNNILHHSLVLPLKSNKSNSSHVVVIIAELLTVDNTSFNIEYFLRLLKTKYQVLHKKTKLARSIVTDKSYANINAIINSQNNINLVQYLKLMHQAVYEGESITDIVLVFLCSSHLGKNWKNDIFKSFRYLEKEQIYFVYALIGNLVNISFYDDLKLYIEQLIIFFCTPTTNEQFINAFDKLKSLIDDNEDEIIDCENDIEEEISINEDANQEISNSIAIYKQSPFFMQFNSFLKSLTFENGNDDSENLFYSPAFMKEFLKKSIAILPLWSKVFVQLGVESTTNYVRPNNGYVEGHFSSLKNHFRNNLAFGRLGTIKVGRYVRFWKDTNAINLKKVEIQLPDHHMARKSKKKDETLNSMSVEKEQWKGRASDVSTVLFNKGNLTKKIDSAKKSTSSFQNKKQNKNHQK